MKNPLGLLALAFAASIALAQTSYNQFSPGGALSGTWNSQNVNLAAGSSFITGLLPIGNGGLGTGPITGIVKGTGVGYGAAGVSDILGLFSGICSATTVLHGGGACGQVSLTADVTGTLPMGNGGLGATSFTANDVLLGNGGSPFSVLALGADTLLHGTGAAPNALSVPNCGSGTTALAYSTTSHTFSCQTISVGTGTVTSVALTVPSIFSISGSPCTTTCSLAMTLASESGNTVFVGPNGSSGTPTFRALVGADIPQINLSCSSGNGCITGIAGVPNGGTGQNTYNFGDLLYGNSTSAASLGKLTGNVTTVRNFLIDVGVSPPTNGTLTQTAGGTLGATTYFVKSTWVGFNGETLGAVETSLAVSANNVLNVAAPGSAPPSAVGWNVYVSTTTGTETKQNTSTIALATPWVEPTSGLIAGVAVPVANTMAGAPAWGLLTAADVPAPGSTNQILFNDAGALAGASNFTIDPATGDVTITAPSSGTALAITPASGADGITVKGAQAAAQVDLTPDEATFTVTGTGFTTTTTATAIWHRVGDIAYFEIESPGLSGTSNSTSFTITGIPSYAQPATFPGQECVAHVVDNTAENPAGSVSIPTASGTWNMTLNGSTTGWTASGTKGWGVQVCTYILK